MVPDHHLVLTREVLVFATMTACPADDDPSDNGLWKALIKVVPGRDHEEEWKLVLDYGDTLAEDVARALFPAFNHVEYER